MASSPPQQLRSKPVHRALEQLPEEQRTLIALVYWAGLTPAEVAARLNISPETVTARTRSALTQLAGRLDDEQAVTRAR